MGIRASSAFSLIELVVVIIILGVIAAIAVPKLSRAARNAGAEAVRNDLAILRSAIQTYAVEHEDRWPDANVALQLTQYTDLTGSSGAPTPNPGSGIVQGPYLKAIPPLPVGSRKGATDIYPASTVSPPSGPPTNGWWYSTVDGDIRANLPSSNVDDDGVPFVVY